MKQAYLIYICILFGLGLATALLNACAKDEEPATAAEEPVFQLRSSAVYALATAGTYSIPITGNTRWAAVLNTGSTAWCAIAPNSGEKSGAITLIVYENESGKERKAAIAVRAAGIDNQQTVAVTQYSYAPAIVLEKSDTTLPASAAAYPMTVFSTQDWSAEVSAAATWCSLTGNGGTAGNGNFIISVAENVLYDVPRSATITVRTPDLSQTIAVTQSASTVQLNISPATFSVASKNGGVFQVNVSGNAAWTAESSDTWCIPSQTAGNGPGTVTLTILPNPGKYKRTATVVFAAAGAAPKPLRIDQEGSALTFVSVISENPIAATPQLATYPIHIESNVGWTVTKDPAATWFSVSPATGASNGTVTVSILAYHPTQTQSATITVAPQNPAHDEAKTVVLNATYEGVEFNGVIWAPTDVDDPGKFVPVVGKPGKLYQFGKAIPWYSGIPVDGVEWWGNDCGNPVNRGGDWDEAAQPVCPDGWRIATSTEMGDLMDYGSALQHSVSKNGYNCFGVRDDLLYFTLGGRLDCTTKHYGNAFGVWTSTSCHGAYAWEMRGEANWYAWECDGSSKGNKARGHAVRCVKK
jgi:uncharacterized protein (TIGR02145 family)